MSTLQKLKVQGIRSFGPESPQIIQFKTPLTVIVGPNGSGKTTIIECLKYLATGDWPPNSNRGRSFIHHPQVANEVEVRGQIMLQIKDIQENEITCTRSLVASQKAKKLEMKTLDSVIRRKNARTGVVSEISSKCAEIDMQMTLILGVSKPILNYVIFCHQEDSNWPMCEGKALKQKFDEIFTATHYIKALEVIRKRQTELNHNITFSKKELEHMETIKNKADQLAAKITERKNRLAATEDKINEIKLKMKPLEDKLKDIQKKEKKINEIEVQKGKHESSLRMTKDSEKALLNKIKCEYQGSKEQLEHELGTFHQKIEHNSTLIEKLARGLEDLQSKINFLNREKPLISNKIGSLESKIQAHRESMSRCDSFLLDLSTQDILSTPDPNHTTLKSEVATLKAKISSFARELANTKESFEGRDRQFKKNLDALQKQLTTLENTETNNHNQIKKSTKEIEEIKNELNDIEALSQEQGNIDQDLEKKENYLKKLESAMNIDAEKKKLSDLKAERSLLDSKYEKLCLEIKKVQMEQGTRTQINICKQDMAKKEASINELLGNHRSTILHLLGEFREENLKGRISQHKRNLVSEIEKYNKMLSRYQNNLSSLQTKKDLLRKQIKERTELAESLRDEISLKCGLQDPFVAHVKVEQEIKELQDSKGELIGAQHVFKKYLKKLEEEEASCPLCHQAFAQKQQVIRVIQEIEDELIQIPSKIEWKQKAIESKNNKLKDLIKMQPTKERLDQIENNEIPKMKKEQDSLNQQISQLTDEISKTQETLDSFQMDNISIDKVIPDMNLLEKLQQELRNQQRNCSSLQKQLGSSSDKDLDQLYKDQEEIKQRLDDVSKQVAILDDKLQAHISKVQEVKGQVQHLQGEKLKISSRLGNKKNLEDKQQELQIEISKSQALIKRTKNEIQKLKDKIRDVEDERSQVNSEKENALENIRDKEKMHSRHLNSLNTYLDDIKRYEAEGAEEALQQAQAKLKQVEKEIQRHSTDYQSKKKDHDELLEAINTEELKKRELQDNLDLIRCRENIVESQSAIEELEIKLDELGARNISSIKNQLGNELKTHETTHQHALGRKAELAKEIKNDEKEMAEKTYRDAHENFRLKCIDKRVSELTHQDLKKYHDALDRAVIEYHRIKMNELNQIIRELWTTVYKGNDIEAIEIVSEFDEALRGGQDSKVRQSYNYKLVMIKNGARLDMRSHSSAGQKVLASLIIRLALAETFCLNCGIFALDEPTTNLDIENIESLANALIELVESRMSKKNFQLIIITHDEEFLNLLGRSSSVDNYFKVYKNEDGLSQVRTYTIGQIL